MTAPTPDEPKDKREEEQRALNYLWQIVPKTTINLADIQVIKGPGGYDVCVLASRPVDKKKDKAEKKRKPSRPRKLDELKAVNRRALRDKKQGITQEESVREYVEEHYPQLATEAQILRK